MHSEPGTSKAGREPGHDPVPAFETVPLDRITPAKINDVIYKPIDPDDPGIRELAASIRDVGLKSELVLTLDDVILSGHRRAAACRLAGLHAVPVRREPITSDHPDFEKILVTHNMQRDKSPAERIREQIVLADPEDAYRDLVSHRAEKAKVRAAAIPLGERRDRHKISRARRPLLDAVRRVLDELEEYWPLTDRRIHYVLLDDPPLKHASKPDSAYANDKESYKTLTNFLTCARIEGLIPWEAIGDETRPVAVWNVYPNVSPFVAEQVEGLLTGYARDLMVGQPNHVEIVGEKMTVEGTIRPVAAEFCIPYTIGRGYSSLPPRKDMHDRFRKSGKSRLVILYLNDHDPEGVDIPTAHAKSMRDDFGIRPDEIHPVRVALNPEQVRELKLPPNTEAKVRSSRFKKFAAKYGRFAYELDAVPPATLRRWLRDAITGVIDVGLFNEQVEREKRDAAEIAATRNAATEYLKRLVLGPEGGAA